jgi:hypothetical protein
MKKNHFIGYLIAIVLLFLATHVAAAPYATLTADPAGVCVKPGNEVTYIWTYGGDFDGWNYVEFNWDPNAMDLVDYDSRCTNVFADRIVCDQAGGFGGAAESRFVTLKIKESVTSGTSFDIFGWAETNVGPWKSGKTTVTTPVCLPTNPYKTMLLTDKTAYSPGDTIIYQVWVDVLTGPYDPNFDLYTAEFNLDPNIESITDNMPDYCSISGNKVFCESNDPQTETGLWPMFIALHQKLWVVIHGQSPDFSVPFTITGKIKMGTPDNTIIKSTADSWGMWEDYVPVIKDHSESEVVISACTGSSCVPEFPSAILPVTTIIGFLGVVILIQRTKEH